MKRGSMSEQMRPGYEDQYLDLAERILEEGEVRGDRTGVGTRELFGEQMKFDLRDEFPALTTKKNCARQCPVRACVDASRGYQSSLSRGTQQSYLG